MIDFKLSDEFVDSYRDKEVPWGYKDAAGNSLGELVFLRTYSRTKEDGTKETWVDTCRRVIEGMFSIQKRHCRSNHIEWKNDKAQRTAKDAFDRLFNMKWLPAGRGLWAMGSPIVMDDNNSAPLQSCAFVSTENSVVEAMTFLFDASMLGVGVGFDADGAGKFYVSPPSNETRNFVIPDSREGWVESLKLLLEAYIKPGTANTPTNIPVPVFDYSEIRPYGEPIKRFGGKASGPGPLKKMHELIQKILERRSGSTITMTDIADIGNIIGTCVVAGNVRRCLPSGTMVHLTNGLTPIENVKVGDVVETSGTLAKVTNVFDQGEQATVRISYVGGELECTPNHRVAVFDSLTSWTFKRADELTSEDRLVWDRFGIQGTESSLPPVLAKVRKKRDTVGQEVTVPDLNPDSAWLLGLIQGDGYVFTPAGTSPNGYVSIACSSDHPEVVTKAELELSRWGVRVKSKVSTADAAIRVTANSTALAEYLKTRLKVAKKSMDVPSWISRASREVRAGYLAGLFDADGSVKTRPLQALVTIYPDFAAQVVDLYASLGIQVRPKLVRPATGKWQALYTVDVVGGHNIRAWEALIGIHSQKYNSVAPQRSAHGATFSTEMVREFGFKSFDNEGGESAERIESYMEENLPAIPYQVLSVTPTGKVVQTWDIEVEGIHQFTAEGIVVHNSAEIFFVDSDSEDFSDFLNLKNSKVNPERNDYSTGWAYMSNNSVRAKVGEDLSAISEGIKLNGEPGVVWMDVIRKYGRLIDAPDYKDTRVRGLNPCSFGGEALVHTSEGPRTIESLNGVPFKAMVNGEEHDSPSGSYVTGTKELYNLVTEEGFEVVLTDNHEVLLTNGEWVESGKLATGDKIVLHNHGPKHSWDGEGTTGEGYIIGAILGDGYINSQGAGMVQVWDNDGEESANAMKAAVTDELAKINSGLGTRSDATVDFSYYPERGIHTKSVTSKLMQKWGLTPGNKHINQKMECGSSDFQSALLRGIFDADGHVEGWNNDKGLTVRLVQSNYQDLQAVQRMLLRLGIVSKIRKAKDAGTSNLPDGKGNYKEYKTKASWRLLISASSVRVYADRIGFTHKVKADKLATGLSKGPRGSYKSKFVATFKELTFNRVDEVWDLSVDDKRAFDANGLYVHNSEQPLEHAETCVSGDTLIPTRLGTYPIQDLVGKDVDIWNGEKWSTVTPFSTGRNSLIRVHLSDGSYLDATPKHKWETRRKTEATFKKRTTNQLEIGMYLPEFDLSASTDEGDEDPLAYTYGWIAGDGFVDGKRAVAIVQTSHADKVMDNLEVKAVYPEQNFCQGSSKTFNRVVVDMDFEDARTLRQDDRLPQRVMEFSPASLRKFFGAWVDTDGSVVKQVNTDNFVIYGSEGMLRQAQVLLRRIGVNHASLQRVGNKGDQTNYAIRNKDLYRLYIPSFESGAITTAIKKAERVGSRFAPNNAHLEGQPIDRARKQKIVKLELISEDADTYCFTEPERGMGVFGNVLTYQCNLVEVFINNCEDRDDFIKTLKVAYLYGKTVTLMPTKWEKTNTVMQRNRRIGLSASGVADYVDIHGMAELRDVLNDGFKYVLKLDNKYSEWLCIRESIRHTTMKPSGSISILAGSSPGAHWTPGGEYFIRRITFSKTDPLFIHLKESGYTHEDFDHDPNSAVILFPVHTKSKRSASDVPAWEKIHLASEIQAWWSDNAVSCTVDFKPEEADQIPTLLAMYDGKLKGISFLPSIDGGAYKHMPYEKVDSNEFESMALGLTKANFSDAYSSGPEAAGEKFCSSDHCEIEEEVSEAEGDYVSIPEIVL